MSGGATVEMAVSGLDLDAFAHDVLPINGLRMHVARIGEARGEAPLVVCLHGFPDLWCGWARVMSALSDQFACVAPDQRGYNFTSRPDAVEAYRPEHLLADIGALIAHLSPHRPVVLAGHDWGGILACWFAATQPAQVEKLVLVNATHPAIFQRALWRDAGQRAASGYIDRLRSGEVERQFASVGLDTVAQARNRAAIEAGTMTAAEADLYRTAWSTPQAWRAMIDWYRAAPFELTPPAAGADWTASFQGKVAAPTLLIWGEQDQVFLPVLRDGMVAFAPDLRIDNIADIGHNPLRDAPAAVADAMRTFLTRDSP